MLSAERVSVTFGGVHALEDVTIRVEPGVVTGLIGPNGAGKTTLFNVVTGLQRPNSGRVLLNNRDVTHVGAKRRARLGLGRTFQRLEVFGSLSARDNVLVALEGRGWLGRPRKAADALLERVGIAKVADTRADILPTGMARLLELARVLATDSKVLLLDEPSSGLNAAESAALGELLVSLASDGKAVLLVEHDMELVMRICTGIYVLDFGHLIASGAPAEIRADPAVQAAYLGTQGVEVEQ